MGEEEGIIFDVNYKEPGAESVQRDFHIHVVGDPDSYKDLQTKGYKNGLEQDGKKLMDITQPAGYKVDLKMYFTEPDKTDPIEMKEVYLSFFDIDGGPDHGEFVTAKGMSQYLLQKTSAIVKEEKDDGSINFQSPKGDNAPNVQDPAKMEPKQLNHALTLHFEKSKEWTFTLGSIGEKKDDSLRKFTFLGSPSLLCAQGADPEGVQTVAAKTDENQCCMIKAGSLQIMCAPESEKGAINFMC